MSVVISIIGIVIFTICLAIMDNISSYDTLSLFFIKRMAKTESVRLHRLYGNLCFWFRNDGWENKLQLKEWLNDVLHLPLWLAKKLAADVLVIITDGWHFCKFVGIYCILVPHTQALLTCFHLPYNLWTSNLVVSLLQGTLFNILFYKISRLKNK